MPVAALVVYLVAALAEIVGCFAVWAVIRLDRSPLWLLPGAAALALFAYALTRSPAGAAGRAFAAYGGIYIVASLGWLILVEGGRPTRFDLAGAALALTGCIVILAGVARG